MKIKKAFTLIEVLIVVAVLAIVAIFTIPSFLGGSHTADLNSVSQQIASSLREAQSQSAGQVQGMEWGVHFSNATNTAPFYAVFTGTSYATGTVQSVYRLPATVGFVSSTLPLGSAVDVTFSPVSGASGVSTTIQLYVLSQPSLSSTITIQSAGQIAYVTPTTPVGSESAESAASDFYVVDQGGSRVEKFDPSGNYLAQFTTSVPSLGQSYPPAEIAVDAQGNIYVSGSGGGDLADPRVEKFDPSGNYLSDFGSYGSGNGQLNGSRGIAIDASGNLWVVDSGNNRVEEFNASGTYLFQFGSNGSGNGQFNVPEDIAIDASGNFWVTDSDNNRVEKFSSSGTYLSQFGSYGSGNGQFQFGDVRGIAIDASGNLWVVDSGNNRVEEFNASGTFVSSIDPTGATAFSSPSDIAIDASGNIWVTDSGNNRVEKFSSSGTYLSQFGSGGSGNGQFNASYGPQGIVIH